MDSLLAGITCDTSLVQRILDDGGTLDVNCNEKVVFAERVAMRITAMCEELRMQREKEEEVVISVKDLQNLKRGIDVVTVWWLLPLLLPGVGLPMAKRVSRTLLPFVRSAEVVEKDANGRPDLGLLKVLDWMRSLYEIPFAKAVMQEHHTADVFAGYLQVCFAPNYWRGQREEQKNVLFTFLAFVGSLDVRIVLENMTVLVGPTSPAWLSSQASSLLSQTLLRPGGVAALLTMLMDLPEARSAAGTFEKAATLITRPPRTFKEGDAATYHRKICGHLVGCFRSRDDAVRRCVATCVEQLLHHGGGDTVQKFLLDKVAAPFLAKGDWTEDRVDNAVADLTLLIMPCGGGGGPVANAFWSWFRGCSHRILSLACCVQRSASRLRTPVMQLLESCIRLPEVSVARAMVHTLLFAVDLPQPSSWRLGPTGGAVEHQEEEEEAQGNLWELKCRLVCEALSRAPPASGLYGDVFAEALSCVCVPGVAEHRLSMMIQLCTEMIDCNTERILHDAVQVFMVLRAVLQAPAIDDELCGVVVGLLDAILGSGATFQKHQEVLLLDLVPALQDACASMSLPQLKAQCMEVCTRILDPNAAWRRPAASSAVSGTNPDDEAFVNALRDLNDPLLPVRAHALITLRKLVLQKDRLTLENFGRVVEALRAQLCHEDSYIFLGAVQAFSALGDVRPNAIIPVLIHDFHAPSVSEDVRLKVGEACVMIAQRCGQMLPVFAPLLMDCFLRGVRDQSAVIRASSLGSIGQMCQVLRWALHPYIREILHAVQSVLQTEREVLVRRAAVLVLALIIRGMGTEIFELIRDAVASIIQPLRHLEQDPDELVRIHAQEAIWEIEEALKIEQ